MPKSFLAVNLSDAFSFQEKERHNSEGDILERNDSETAASKPLAIGQEADPVEGVQNSDVDREHPPAAMATAPEASHE